ncbi:MAG: adenylyl-sulfate kinase [Candidatus Omnitrophota bacterium]
MYNAHKRYALFVGRWQPFHNGHKYLVDQALAKGKHVCIAIRDTEISEKNPYTVKQRMEMIWRVYGDRVKSIVIPDIESINIGRKVGYDVVRVDPPKSIAKISGTNVRAGKDSNIPPKVARYIKTLRTTLWLTGLPCAGKTTLAKRIKAELDNRGYNTTHLDGDDVRNALNENLGFSVEDRKENLRRIAHVAKLFNKSGIFVIASFVSPTIELRGMVKKIVGNFKLVYVKCNLDECERRDVKGMYKRARRGEIAQFTGVSAPFEEPKTANIVIDTKKNDIETCVEHIIKKLNV